MYLILNLGVVDTQVVIPAFVAGSSLLVQHLSNGLVAFIVHLLRVCSDSAKDLAIVGGFIDVGKSALSVRDIAASAA